MHLDTHAHTHTHTNTCSPPVDNPLKVTRISQNIAQINWVPPQALLFGAEGLANGLNISAVSVSYTLYFAENSFTSVATKALNATAADLGILPTTACGLDRWARLVNFSAPVFNSSVSSFSLKGLKPSTMYRVIVVATCDHNCLLDNAAALGLPPPTGS